VLKRKITKIPTAPEMVSSEPRKAFPWRLLWFLLIAAILAAAAAIPFVLEILSPMIQNGPPLPIPVPLIVVLGVAENLLLFGVMIGIGLLLARKMGLGAPLLESWLYHEVSPVKVRDSFKSGVLVGLAVGIVLLIIVLPIAPHMPDLPFVKAAQAPIWKRLLVCFYGGIDEEILTRLFLLTLFAWLGLRFFQKQKARLTSTTFWIANGLAAILFGLGHLPAASRMMRITPKVVLLALALNGIAAIPFGYLYRKRGLESAMIAHFCADFLLYVVGPLFIS
jgi:hypothetical protein